MALLGHSAGANLATLYAARYPERVGRLVLITPSGGAVGIAVTGEMRLDTARLRADEPWFPAAFAALQAVISGHGTDDDWTAVAPFWYARWDANARDYHAAASGQRNDEAAAVFAAEGAFSPEATRAALATFDAPVLLVAGEFDVNSPRPAVAAFAALFPAATLVVQPGASHSPWLDDAEVFASTVTTFLR
jgi:pimeloyl-ACP methyl ester carboxylesterase